MRLDAGEVFQVADTKKLLYIVHYLQLNVKQIYDNKLLCILIVTLNFRIFPIEIVQIPAIFAEIQSNAAQKLVSTSPLSHLWIKEFC